MNRDYAGENKPYRFLIPSVSRSLKPYLQPHGKLPILTENQRPQLASIWICNHLYGPVCKFKKKNMVL